MSNETQKGKERETAIGKESDADFSLRAVGLKVVANTMTMYLHEKDGTQRSTLISKL